MSTKLEKVRKALKRNKKVDMKNNRVVLDPTKAPVHDHISTASIVLDHLIGGNIVKGGHRQCPGIPKGRITEIFGPEGSGKTTVALQTAAECQRNGGSVVFLDYENALDHSYAQKLGVDYNEEVWDLYNPTTWEEGAEIINIVADCGVDLVIIDSVSAMVPEALYDKNISELGQIGLLARLQSTFLPRIVPTLNRNGTTIIYLNQVRSRIKTSRYDPGPDEDTSGGRALKFYCSLRVSLQPLGTEYIQVENDLTGEMEKQPIARITRAKIQKTKVSSHQHNSADLVIRYGEGVDNIRSVMDIAEKRGIIDKGGSWYSFYKEDGEEVRVQGKDTLRDHFVANPADYIPILQTVRGYLDSAALKQAGELGLDSLEGLNSRQLIDLALDKGVIWQAGPWYKMVGPTGDEESHQGFDNLLEALEEQPELRDFLKVSLGAASGDEA